ncbi:MAG: phenazine biosynthesis PhzC/PhzF protein [Comamonadaceae bacterium]|nr:MAG: phenazine biosynthesis PhzC/PhzF protein [Comamonadaceae bacterium]
MKTRPFKQVDVFTDAPYLGNPLAVVLDGTGLSTDEMQHFAHWTNLSETTFLLPPTPEAAAQGADYQVRIFTTAYEMPFAGHPTLGSCHAWLEAGGQPRHPEFIVQQCPVGLVRIRHSAQPIAFAAPALKRSPATPDSVVSLRAALGLNPAQVLAAQHLNNGPRHFGLLLDRDQTVQQIEPDPAALRAWMLAHDISGVGVASVDQPGHDHGLIKRSNREARAFVGNAPTLAQVNVRFFANDVVVIEDPITGSFNASLAQWLIADGLAPKTYTATQGIRLGRFGQVQIAQDETGQVWVGGASVTCINGTVNL